MTALQTANEGHQRVSASTTGQPIQEERKVGVGHRDVSPVPFRDACENRIACTIPVEDPHQEDWKIDVHESPYKPLL